MKGLRCQLCGGKIHNGRCELCGWKNQVIIEPGDNLSSSVAQAEANNKRDKAASIRQSAANYKKIMQGSRAGTSSRNETGRGTTARKSGQRNSQKTLQRSTTLQRKNSDRLREVMSQNTSYDQTSGKHQYSGNPSRRKNSRNKKSSLGSVVTIVTVIFAMFSLISGMFGAFSEHMDTYEDDLKWEDAGGYSYDSSDDSYDSSDDSYDSDWDEAYDSDGSSYESGMTLTEGNYTVGEDAFDTLQPEVTYIAFALEGSGEVVIIDSNGVEYDRQSLDAYGDNSSWFVGELTQGMEVEITGDLEVKFSYTQDQEDI